MASTYKTKKGTMHQINVSVKDDIARKFDEICEGDSRSVIFSQWVREKYVQKVLGSSAMRRRYSILGEGQDDLPKEE